MAGHCADVTADCHAIKAYNSSATDGMYAHLPTGQSFYCDMTNGGVQYETLTYTNYNIPPTGMTLITGADLATAGQAKAFIALYNFQGGVNTTAAFSVGNCCTSTSTTARLQFGAASVRPNGTCGGPYGPGLILVSLNGTAPVNLPMPPDFFTTNVPSDGTQCGDAGNNPGLFWKKTP